MADRLAGIEALAALMQRLPKTPEVAQQVASAIDASSLDRGDIELVLIAEWWTPFDPDGALAWSMTHWRAEHPRITYAVLRSMARIDPQRAVDAYLEMNVDRETYGSRLQPIIVGWHESEKPGLTSFITSQPSSELQQLALATLCRMQVLSLGPQAAADWAETVAASEDEALSRQISQRTASSIAEIDPAFAATWVERLIREEGASETLLRRVAGRWGRRDPVAAMDWLSGFAPTAHQQQALSQTFNLWLARAPDEAERWLLAQNERIGTTVAPATLQLIKRRAGMAQALPEEPVDWTRNLDLALQIEDQEMRWGAVTYLTRVWIKRDEPSATAWIEAHSVPETYRRKIMGAAGQEGMKPIVRPDTSPGN
jgi:hypothetical protein